MLKRIITESQKFSLELLSVICPPIAIAKEAKEYLQNIANIILIGKIERFVESQDKGFENWLRISCNFQKDSVRYKETVKILIYTINAINDDKKIDVYANLMRAYRNNLIDRDCLLRLSSFLPTIFYNDLIFLKENVSNEISEDIAHNAFLSIEALNLLNCGLLSCINSATYACIGGKGRYKISTLGIEMVRCGIDYDNYSTYKVT